MHRRTTRLLRRALPLLLLSLLLVPGLWAKDKAEAETDDSSDLAVHSTGAFGFESSLAWANDGTASAVDWRATKDGLKFGLNADGSLDLTFRTLPGVSTGALVHLETEGAFNAKSPSASTPYMVLNGADATALTSWYLGTESTSRGLTTSFRGTLDGGLRVLALSDSDYDYQPSTADGEAFWFRVLPVVGSSQKAVLAQAGFLTLKAKNQLLLWWDAETSYGRNWNLGFEDTVELSLTGTLAQARSYSWTWETFAAQNWDSGIVEASSETSFGLRTALEAKDGNRIRLTPAVYEYQAPDGESLVAGKVDWKIDAGKATWGLGLQWPWAAWNSSGSSDESLKKWKLTCKTEF